MFYIILNKLNEMEIHVIYIYYGYDSLQLFLKGIRKSLAKLYFLHLLSCFRLAFMVQRGTTCNVSMGLWLRLGLGLGLGLRLPLRLLPVNAEQFRADRCATDKKAVSCQALDQSRRDN